MHGHFYLKFSMNWYAIENLQRQKGSVGPTDKILVITSAVKSESLAVTHRLLFTCSGATSMSMTKIFVHHAGSF